jgi:hypothetical protein
VTCPQYLVAHSLRNHLVAASAAQQVYQLPWLEHCHLVGISPAQHHLRVCVVQCCHLDQKHASHSDAYKASVWKFRDPSLLEDQGCVPPELACRTAIRCVSVSAQLQLQPRKHEQCQHCGIGARMTHLLAHCRVQELEPAMHHLPSS